MRDEVLPADSARVLAVVFRNDRWFCDSDARQMDHRFLWLQFRDENAQVQIETRLAHIFAPYGLRRKIVKPFETVDLGQVAEPLSDVRDEPVPEVV